MESGTQVMMAEDDATVLAVITAFPIRRGYAVTGLGDALAAREGGRLLVSVLDQDTGAGLGLAIVQGIVEALGGHVHAGHVNQGFCLTVALPA